MKFFLSFLVDIIFTNDLYRNSINLKLDQNCQQEIKTRSTLYFSNKNLLELNNDLNLQINKLLSLIKHYDQIKKGELEDYSIKYNIFNNNHPLFINENRLVINCKQVQFILKNQQELFEMMTHQLKIPEFIYNKFVYFLIYYQDEVYLEKMINWSIKENPIFKHNYKILLNNIKIKKLKIKSEIFNYYNIDQLKLKLDLLIFHYEQFYNHNKKLPFSFKFNSLLEKCLKLKSNLLGLIIIEIYNYENSKQDYKNQILQVYNQIQFILDCINTIKYNHPNLFLNLNFEFNYQYLDLSDENQFKLKFNLPEEFNTNLFSNEPETLVKNHNNKRKSDQHVNSNVAKSDLHVNSNVSSPKKPRVNELESELNTNMMNHNIKKINNLGKLSSTVYIPCNQTIDLSKHSNSLSQTPHFSGNHQQKDNHSDSLKTDQSKNNSFSNIYLNNLIENESL